MTFSLWQKARSGLSTCFLRIPSRRASDEKYVKHRDLPPVEFRPALRISGLTITLRYLHRAHSV
ncbi:hypothetical protein KCP74_09280 [Salmonella enterica subsp. enterica]|nr:hypothetical protein KCP74_09280 [Salmonella enterica subsp. enterica]